MDWFPPVVIAFAVASACLGWKLGLNPPKIANLYGAIACGLILIGALFFHQVHWWPEVFISRGMMWADITWFVPPALALFFLAISHAREKEKHEGEPNPDPEWVKSPLIGTKRRAVSWKYSAGIVIWMSGCVLFFSLHQIYGRLHTADWWEALPVGERAWFDKPRVDMRHKFLYQRTSFTCGPTSVANIMRLTGVDPNCSDNEMALACMMSYHGEGDGGSSVLGMALGMKAKGEPAGYHVKIFCPDVEELKELRKPMLISVLYGPVIRHAVVLCEIDPERGALILDPLEGYYWENWPNFKKIFLNAAIVMFKSDPKELSPPVALTRPKL